MDYYDELGCNKINFIYFKVVKWPVSIISKHLIIFHVKVISIYQEDPLLEHLKEKRKF